MQRNGCLVVPGKVSRSFFEERFFGAEGRDASGNAEPEAAREAEMSVSKDKARGTYYVQCQYRDWQGKLCKKIKRGFTSERATRRWEHDFLLRIEGAPT